MTSRRLLTLSPDYEAVWLRLYVEQIEERWAATLLADEAPPPEPGTVKDLAYFGRSPEEAGEATKVYLGCAEPAN